MMDVPESENFQKELLESLGNSNLPTSEELKNLLLHIGDFRLLAKIFLLEGTPYVFRENPMKYVIFREQVADRFDIGSQDVCIVGSAKLGFSPSPRKFGNPFSKTSDVDVVVISEPLFYKGSNELFFVISRTLPNLSHQSAPNTSDVSVKGSDWKRVKESARNFVLGNFNPGLLPDDNQLKKDVFEKITSMCGLFLALEPKVFVSKIRARVFKNWKSVETYYSNTLREARNALQGTPTSDTDEEEGEELSLDKDISAEISGSNL